MEKVNIVDLAGYIVEEYGPMNHLKIQKLLYFIQGFHMGILKASLFDEDFEAWVHGPVVRNLYTHLKRNDILMYQVIEKVPEANTEAILCNLDDEQRELVDDVLKYYSKKTAEDLERMSHRTKPWIKTRGNTPHGDRCTDIIPKRMMKQYFEEMTQN